MPGPDLQFSRVRAAGELQRHCALRWPLHRLDHRATWRLPGLAPGRRRADDAALPRPRCRGGLACEPGRQQGVRLASASRARMPPSARLPDPLDPAGVSRRLRTLRRPHVRPVKSAKFAGTPSRPRSRRADSRPTRTSGSASAPIGPAPSGARHTAPPVRRPASAVCTDTSWRPVPRVEGRIVGADHAGHGRQPGRPAAPAESDRGGHADLYWSGTGYESGLNPPVIGTMGWSGRHAR